MYYKRFNEKDLNAAMANEVITLENMRNVLDFYESGVFVLKGPDDVRRLQRVIPDSTVLDRVREDDLYRVRVDSWPHIKAMCLKFERKNPCKWTYVSMYDDANLLWYDLNAGSVRLPEDPPA